jgi:hypothetical protein
MMGTGSTIASVSPLEEFLHQVSELDTLGYDRPETKCRLRWMPHTPVDKNEVHIH